MQYSLHIDFQGRKAVGFGFVVDNLVDASKVVTESAIEGITEAGTAVVVILKVAG